MKELKLFGKRIKELRVGQGLSQEKLSEKAGISSKYMSRIEMGWQFPSFQNLTKLARALEVELKDFFEFSHEAESVTELREISDQLLNEAGEEKLRVMVKVLRALAR